MICNELGKIERHIGVSRTGIKTFGMLNLTSLQEVFISLLSKKSEEGSDGLDRKLRITNL